eukprot:scaffold561_cov380-Pavlova_lutheri.AAC.13
MPVCQRLSKTARVGHLPHTLINVQGQQDSSDMCFTSLVFHRPVIPPLLSFCPTMLKFQV